MICRSEIKNKYSIIPNSVIRAEDISDGDYRLLIYLYSLPDKWKISQGYLAQQMNCNKRNVNAKIARIKEAGYLEIIKANKEDKATDYIYILKEKDTSVNDTSLADTSVNDTSVDDVYINTNIIKTDNINNELNKKNNISKEILKSTYFEDNELNELFNDFLKLRKELKAKNTERAINNLLNKLNKYDNETKKQMINNSITNSWKDVYELKNKSNTSKSEVKYETV